MFLLKRNLTVFPPVFIGRKHLLGFTQILPVSRLTSTKSIWLLFLFTVLFTFVLHTKTFHEEILKIKTILSENCFPKSIVDRIIKSFLDKQFCPKKPVSNSEERQTVLFSLPFLGQFSLQVKTKLVKLLKQCYPDVKFQVIFKSPRRLPSSLRFKDRFANLMCSNAIYKHTCSGCDATYHGKTKIHLIVRCREHLGINKAGQKINSNSSSIGDHISKFGHKASFDDFEIISKADNHFDLLIHESLLIKRDTPSLNSQTSSIPMALF